MIQKNLVLLVAGVFFCAGTSLAYALGGQEDIETLVLNPASPVLKGDWFSAATGPTYVDSVLDPFLGAYSKLAFEHSIADAAILQEVLDGESSIDLLYLDPHHLAEQNFVSKDNAKDLSALYLLYGESLGLSDAITLGLGDSRGIYAFPYAVRVINMFFFTPSEQLSNLETWEDFFTLTEERALAGEKTIYIDGKSSLLGFWESVLLSVLGYNRYTALVHGFIPVDTEELIAASELFVRILEHAIVSEEGNVMELPVFYSSDSSTNYQTALDSEVRKKPIPETNEMALLRMMLMLVPRESRADVTNTEWLRYINKEEQLQKRTEAFIAAEQSYLVPQKNNPLALTNTGSADDAFQYSSAIQVLSVFHSAYTFSPDALSDLLMGAATSQAVDLELLTQNILALFTGGI